jgi:hypothetical protein
MSKPSFTVIRADDYEAALAIARACPGDTATEICEMADPMSEPRGLVEHFFRHEFDRLGAVLTRSLGVRGSTSLRTSFKPRSRRPSALRGLAAWSITVLGANAIRVSSQSEGERWQARFPEWTRIWNIIGVTFTPVW